MSFVIFPAIPAQRKPWGFQGMVRSSVSTMPFCYSHSTTHSVVLYNIYSKKQVFIKSFLLKNSGFQKRKTTTQKVVVFQTLFCSFLLLFGLLLFSFICLGLCFGLSFLRRSLGLGLRFSLLSCVQHILFTNLHQSFLSFLVKLFTLF